MTKRPRSPTTRSSFDSYTSRSSSRLQSPSPARKQPLLDTTQQPFRTNQPHSVIQCELPPHKHPIEFAAYDDHETHYNAQHTNRCLECRRNLPSEHFLNLHIAENHDSIAEAKRAKGEKTYACFVEDCDKFCFSPQKRRMHLMDKHAFPRNYDFFIVNDGIDGKTSMLRPAMRSRPDKQPLPNNGKYADGVAQSQDASSENDADVDAKSQTRGVTADRKTVRRREGDIGAEDEILLASDNSLEALTRSMSALKLIPPSVRFGRQRGVAFSKT